MLLGDVEGEELEGEALGEGGGVRRELRFGGGRERGWHGETRVGGCEGEDAGGGDAVGVGVKFGAGGHLVAEV